MKDGVRRRQGQSLANREKGVGRGPKGKRKMNGRSKGGGKRRQRVVFVSFFLYQLIKYIALRYLRGGALPR